MKGRISPSKRRRLLAEAQAIAEERATTWFVWGSTPNGEVKQYRVVSAKTEREALRKVRRAVAAKPSLPSSQWRAIYQEVGLA